MMGQVFGTIWMGSIDVMGNGDLAKAHPLKLSAFTVA